MNRRQMMLGVLAGCCSSLLVASMSAQMGQSNGPMPSPPAKAEVTLGSTKVTIDYHSPSMRQRKVMGGIVPYGQVWRTGANPATTFVPTGDVMVGSAHVPAGNYTLYTLPGEAGWKLIINKQTGQWGTEYSQDQDLVRVDMKMAKLPAPQEKMSITFEKTSGKTTELHVKWETTDVWVPVSAR